MKKRIISVILTLVMLFGLLSSVNVSADVIKILATKTLKVGQTADVSLTDPQTGEKITTIWESTEPDIATVSAYGVVTGKKKGSCIVSTYWNGKLYGVKVVVKAKTTAYSKLAKYLKKNGTKNTENDNDEYYILWKEDGYVLWAGYRTGSDAAVTMFIGYYLDDAQTLFETKEGLHLYLYKNGKREAAYHKNASSTDRNFGVYGASYKKGKTVNTAKLSMKHNLGAKLSGVNSRARKLAKAGISLWNKFLKARMGLTMKKLGFVYKKSAAKKPVLSKKSATLKAGKKLTLKLKNAKASKVKWTSSKKSVATVSKKGVVKARKKGKAKIIAKYKGKKYTCKLTVKKSG